MRIAALAIALLLPAAAPGTAAPTSADPAPACTLRIHVDGLRNQRGKVGTALFTSAAGWPENSVHAFRRGPTDIPPGATSVIAAWQIPAGAYAVVALHDENENQRLDRNFLGIHKEGFGFANNPRVVFSAPSFAASTIRVVCPVTDIEIRMIYK